MTLVDKVRQLGRVVDEVDPSAGIGPVMETLSALLGVPVSLAAQGQPMPAADRAVTRIPLHWQDHTLGTLLVARAEDEWDGDQAVLIETALMTLGLLLWQTELARHKAVERQEAAVRTVLNTLSYSELILIRQVVDTIRGTQGVVVVSAIAHRAGITHTVLVNALRKLQSAGVIDIRSLGVRGTLIRILNGQLKPALEALNL